MPLGSWIRGLGQSVASLVRGGRRRPDPRESFAPASPLAPGGYNGWTAPRTDQVRAYRHWTYVAVKRIADKVASQCPNVGRVLRDPREDPVARARAAFYRQKALHPIPHGVDLEPVGYDHPLVRLLADPNGPDTDFDLWYETTLFLELTGSAYWWCPRSPITNQPAAIWALPSHWVFPVWDQSGVLTHYELRPDTGGYLRKVFPADEVVHFRWKHPGAKTDGHSAQEAGAQWLDTQLSVDRSRWHTFKNGAFPAAALEFSGDYSDPDDTDLARIEAKFLARYAGETRAGKPLLLPPGVKYHKISLTPAEMDYVKSAEQLRDQILALWGVPALIAGIVKDMTFGAILAANVNFCSVAINPLLRMMARTITEKLAKPYYGDDIIVWWDDTTPDDPANVEAQLKTDGMLGLITPNEGRARRGRRPYEFGGNDPLIPNLGLVLPWGTGGDIEDLNPQAALNAKKNPKALPDGDGGRPQGPAANAQDPGDDEE